MSEKRIDVGSDASDAWEEIGRRIADAIDARPAKRRPKNTGSLTETRPGVWRLRVHRGRHHDGRQKTPVSRTFYGHRRDAEIELARLQLRFGSNTGRSGTDLTIGGALLLWVDAHEDEWLPKTRTNHRSIVGHRLLPIWMWVIDDTTPAQITEFYADLRAEGLAGASVGRIHSCLRSALGWARSQGYCRENPAVDARAGRTRSPEVRIPSEAELRRVLDHLRGTDRWMAAVVAFAAMTGARRGEIAALRWEDVSACKDDRGEVSFRRRQSDGETVEGLKAASEKTLGIPADLVGEMQAISRCDEWVFGVGGRPVHANTLTRRWRSVTESLGLDVGSFNSLRHFCGTHLVSQGELSIVEVARHLGHSRPSTTLDVYAHALAGADPAAAASIGRLLESS